MKVLKVRYKGGKVVFEDLLEAINFMDAFNIPARNLTEGEMSEEEYNLLQELEWDNDENGDCYQ